MLVEPREPAATPAAAAAPAREKLRLGDVLLRQALVTPEQLQEALDHQRGSGKRLGRVLIDGGLVTEDQVAHALARQLRVPAVNLKSFPLKSETVRLLGESPARRHRALVLEDKGDYLLVAFADPLDLFAYDEVTRLLKRPVRIAVVPESQLPPALDRHYRRTEEIQGLAKALEKDVGDAVDFGELQTAVGQEGAPVVRLLQSVFEDAMQVGASDVHLEPQDSGLLIRSRIDGLMQTQTQADKRIAAALAQRLKLMAGLDISEKRLPQDGRFTLRLRDRTIDVRLSTLPTPNGESVVMRLLGQGGAMRRLDEIGMPPAMLVRLREILNRHSGMVLVTGPTGSGKTTTLYAALAEIDVERQKVITVEDPIEYRLPGLTQVQVNDKIELTFARVLRATLRQDPDVILVGEIRDAETAEMAFRAAMTGHQVYSTLHTNSAIGAIPRLLDIGILPDIMAGNIIGIVAQRLLRRLCPHCRKPYTAQPHERRLLGMDRAGLLYRPGGCEHCNFQGYRGRLAIMEVLRLDGDIDELIARRATHREIRTAALAKGFRTLAEDGLRRALDGSTSIDEVARVVDLTERMS